MFANSPETQAALIGAFSALAVVVVKDIFVPFFKSRWKRSSDMNSIYRSYADPLSNSAVSLLWRLDEIFRTGRESYLKRDAPKSKFNVYKFGSTCYRLADFLGWIRAIETELSYLESGQYWSAGEIEKCIREIKEILADGSHVEKIIFEDICKIWGINFEEIASASRLISAKFSGKMYEFLHDNKLMYLTEMKNIDIEHKLQCCNEMADLIKSHTDREISPHVINETKERVVDALAVREWWIYRDWQDAIGDLMIERHSDAPRKFRILGFAEFEKRFFSDGNDTKENHRLWSSRIQNLFIDLDVMHPRKDMRVAQLINIQKKLAELLFILKKFNPRSPIISEDTLSKSAEILRN